MSCNSQGLSFAPDLGDLVLGGVDFDGLDLPRNGRDASSNSDFSHPRPFDGLRTRLKGILGGTNKG